MYIHPLYSQTSACYSIDSLLGEVDRDSLQKRNIDNQIENRHFSSPSVCFLFEHQHALRGALDSVLLDCVCVAVCIAVCVAVSV